MNLNEQKLNNFFAQFQHIMNENVPILISETAVEEFKESFVRKNWEGIAWEQTKNPVKKGSLMVRTAALVGSIRESSISQNHVTISAGSSKVPYARIHNEGGIVTRQPRSETFNRNRFATGKNKGKFKKGTTKGQGFTFKGGSYTMPKRKFMGYSANLTRLIINRLTKAFAK